MEYRLTYQRTNQRLDQEEALRDQGKALQEVQEVQEVKDRAKAHRAKAPLQEEVAQEVGDPEGGTTPLQEHRRKVMQEMRTMGAKEVYDRAKASPLNTSV